jgi:hypothetical protein
VSTIPTKAEVRADVNVLFRSQPPAPVGEKAVEVCVVGKRCVYVNNYRVAGGKPYVSENLPSHTLTTSLKELLNAFPEKDVRAALRERRARRDYFAAYHAQAEDVEAEAEIGK